MFIYVRYHGGDIPKCQNIEFDGVVTIKKTDSYKKAIEWWQLNKKSCEFKITLCNMYNENNCNYLSDCNYLHEPMAIIFNKDCADSVLFILE